jgi:putative oxidoreductase
MNHKVFSALRMVLGVILLFFGINGFLQFMPAPEMGGAAGAFMSALLATGYMIPLVSLLMVVVGLLLVINRFTPLALVLLVPLSVHLVLFHIFLDLASIWAALVVFVLNVVLLLGHLDYYRPMLRARH